MAELLATALIGLVTGLLSGQFGIGGGLVTTPAIRMLLGEPSLIAIGTPLVVIIPTAVTGAVAYVRRGVADPGTGVTLAAWGAPAAVIGAGLTRLVGGSTVLLLTGLLILWNAFDLLRPQRPLDAPPVGRALGVRIALLGVAAGVYSGFLGLGGGFVLVPGMRRWLSFDMKRSIGTSLVAVCGLAVPGMITHALLGHVDWRLAAGLSLGVVPGAWLGSRLTLGASEERVRVSFAVLLVLLGSLLIATETGFVRL